MKVARQPGQVGVFVGIDIAAYHADSESISNSGLLDLATSPFNYFSWHLDPKRPPRPVKAGQAEGSLAHAAILEPETCAVRYAVGPNVNKGSEAWRKFVAKHPTKICIQQHERDTAVAQSLSVHALPEIGTLLQGGVAEASAYWRDPITGVLCRCRPDYHTPVGNGDQVILFDVKTYASAEKRDFMLQVERKYYDRQDALYSDGFALASGKSVAAFTFIAVEDAWPFEAAAYVLPDAWIERGRQKNRELLDVYAKCRAENKWPRISSGVELLPMPERLQREALYA